MLLFGGSLFCPRLDEHIFYYSCTQFPSATIPLSFPSFFANINTATTLKRINRINKNRPNSRMRFLLRLCRQSILASSSGGDNLSYSLCGLAVPELGGLYIIAFIAVVHDLRIIFQDVGNGDMYQPVSAFR